MARETAVKEAEEKLVASKVGEQVVVGVAVGVAGEERGS